MEQSAALLSLRGIRKRFGAVEALRGVDLDVRSGEVLGLLGDNGAGKSTLIKIIAGVQPPSDGHMAFDGREVTSFTPEHARGLGIETIYQDLALAGNLDISLNIFFGRELSGRFLGIFPYLQRRRMRERTEEALSHLRIRIPSIDATVETLSGGQQQAVAIARALYWQARLVIMDEPTAALGVSEHEKVMEMVRKLADAGVAVILITHIMQDALAVTDRIAVLTRGVKAIEADTRELDQDRIVHAMLRGGE